MAQWRKVVVSGSNPVLNQISASGDIVPISDAGSSLGSTTREWNNLYIDGTANIDSLVADTADINGGTVDNATIGVGTHTTIKGTTIDATTDFTIGGTVITDNQIADDGTFTMDLAGDLAIDVDGGDVTITDNGIDLATINATKISGSLASTGSFGRVETGRIDIDSIDGNWTNAGNTVADLGTVSAATSITATNFVGIIGASGTAAGTFTTCDATTNFTIDGLVLTADTITNDSNLTMDLTGDLAIDVDGGDVIITDDGANIATINATKISGSLASTGSFGRVIASTFSGDGSGITGLTSAAIDTVAAMTNNYVITATAGTAVTGEANLQFDGTDLVVAGSGKVAFRDNGGEYIYSVSDNVLGLAAGSEIDLTATTIDINGLVDISGNLTVGGNLDVNGTVTTIDSTNVMVSESFTTHASGSSTAVDGGIGVQFRANGDTRALGWDASGTRWSLQNDLSYTGSLMSPDAYVSTVETGTGDGDSQGNPTYGGATGYGNIYIDTDDGEIWIFA